MLQEIVFLLSGVNDIFSFIFMNFHFFQIVVKVYIDLKEKAEFLEIALGIHGKKYISPVLFF